MSKTFTYRNDDTEIEIYQETRNTFFCFSQYEDGFSTPGWSLLQNGSGSAPVCAATAAVHRPDSTQTLFDGSRTSTR